MVIVVTKQRNQAVGNNNEQLRKSVTIIETMKCLACAYQVMEQN